jgi:predicted metal-dependent phosphoesterase TrpH
MEELPRLIVDLHCHTAPSSPCAVDTAAAMVARAAAMGLGGLVLTEHDAIHPEQSFGRVRAQANGMVLLRGVEIEATGPRGIAGHFLVLGPEVPEGPQASLDDLAQFVERHRCALIQAHPYRFHDHAEELAELLPLHAIEVASVNVRRGTAAAEARDLAVRLGLPMVAGSDAHSTESVGQYATRLTRRVGSAAELAEEIRAGRVEPVSWNGARRTWE